MQSYSRAAGQGPQFTGVPSYLSDSRVRLTAGYLPILSVCNCNSVRRLFRIAGHISTLRISFECGTVWTPCYVFSWGTGATPDSLPSDGALQEGAMRSQMITAGVQATDGEISEARQE